MKIGAEDRAPTDYKLWRDKQKTGGGGERQVDPGIKPLTSVPPSPSQATQLP